MKGWLTILAFIASMTLGYAQQANQVGSLIQKEKENVAKLDTLQDSLKAVQQRVTALKDSLGIGKLNKRLDSTKTTMSSLKAKLVREAKTKLQDSLGLAAAREKLDTLRKSIGEDTASLLKRGEKFTATDSLSNRLKASEGKVAKLKDSVGLGGLHHRLDTFQKNTMAGPQEQLSKAKDWEDSVSQRLQVRDSIQAQFAKVTHYSDSLSNKFHSGITNLSDSIIAVEGEVTGKMERYPQQVQDSIQDKLKNLGEMDSLGHYVKNKTAKIQGISKLSSETEKLSGKMDISTEKGLHLPEIKEPTLNSSIPSEMQGNGGLSVPNAGLPELPKLKVDGLQNHNLNLPDLKETDLNKEIPSLQGKDISFDGMSDIKAQLSGDQLSSLSKKTKKLGDIGQYKDKIKTQNLDQVKALGKAKDLGKKVKGLKGKGKKYSRSIEDIRKGKMEYLDSVANTSFANIKDTKRVAQQQKKMEEWRDSQLHKKDELEKYQNQEEVWATAKKKGKEIATDHFEGYQQRLVKAHKMLFELKQKYSNVPSMKNLDPLSLDKFGDVSLFSRFYFGFNLMVGGNDSTNILDVAPYLGFKVTRKIRIDAGYMWRFHPAISKDKFTFDRLNLDGYRIQLKYKLKKGLAVVGEYEHLKKRPTIRGGESDKVKIYHGAFFGLDKHFRIVNRFYGSTQILFNALYKSGGPYKRPFSIRIGFYIDPRTKQN